MADQEKDNKVKESRQSVYIGENIPNSPSEFREETACELVGPVSLKKSPDASTASSMREETSHELAVIPATRKKAPAMSATNREETSRELAVPVSIHKNRKNPASNREETAAELAAPVSLGKVRSNEHDHDYAEGTTKEHAQAGTGIGFLAIALSIISLFVMPILFGAAGIILGFVARSRGARGLGAWAIGIGVVSIIIGIFIIPFF